MKKMNNSKSIVEAMKECFKKLRLPIFRDFYSKGPLSFRSEISGENFKIYIWVWYDHDFRYANIRIGFSKKVSPERIADTRELLNLINGYMVTHHYWVCVKCGMVQLNSGLFVPRNHLPGGKFERLLFWALEHIDLVFPLIGKMEAKGGSPEDLMSEFLKETP